MLQGVPEFMSQTLRVGINYRSCLYVLILATCSMAILNDCGSKKGEIIDFNVSGCPDLSQRCKLVRGSNVPISVKFQSKTNTDNVPVAVSAVILNVVFPFLETELDACKDGLSCPIQNGESYMYNHSLYIRQDVPNIRAVMQFILKDRKLQNIVCAEFSVKFL